MREVWVRGVAVSYVLGKNTKLTVHLSTQERNMGTCTQCEKPGEFLGGGGGTCDDYVCMCVRGFHIRRSYFHFDLLSIRQSSFTCHRHETRTIVKILKML